MMRGARPVLPWLVLLALLGGACRPAVGPGIPEAPIPSPPLETLDSCARVWARPDRAFDDVASCTLKNSPEDIARAGGVVLLGSSWDASAPGSRLRPPSRCVAHTHEGNRRLVDAVRAARDPGDPPIAFVQLHRFDLVNRAFAALPGFRADFLVRPKRDFEWTLDFFRNDRSATCRHGGCELSFSFQADPTRDAGARLRDLIDAAGAPGAYRQAVYFLARPQPDRPVFWTMAAIGDLTNPGYRAFRVREAQRAIALGHYDAVMLNNKFAQFRRDGGYWIGSENARDVAHVQAESRATLWTSPPLDYGYSDYVRGWAALGRDLQAAGVPYAVWVGIGAWRRSYDDRRTPLDEGQLIRETARGARLVLLQQPIPEPEFARVAGQLRNAGVEAVVRGPGARNTCADARPPPHRRR